MADATPPPQFTPESSLNRSPPAVPEDANQRYWCYSCQRSVMVDREGGEILCVACRNGFVEAIVVRTEESVEAIDELMSQMLTLIAEVEGDVDAVPPRPVDHSSDDDEGDEGDEGDEEEEEEDDDDDDEGEEDDDEGEDDDDDDDEGEDDDDDDDEEDELIEDEEELETEESTELIIQNDENGGGAVDEQERRAEVVRLRLRDIASQFNRLTSVSDWTEIMTGLENSLVELRMHLPETDEYFGNPEDYVDAAGYEALLQNLAENDQSERRGAPAAAKASVAELPTVVVANDGYESCAVCKEGVSVGDTIKKMPCGHGYHEDCIVPWLESRNSCPVCRYELPTDDPEYEEERKKKLGASASHLT